MSRKTTTVLSAPFLLPFQVLPPVMSRLAATLLQSYYDCSTTVVPSVMRSRESRCQPTRQGSALQPRCADQSWPDLGAEPACPSPLKHRPCAQQTVGQSCSDML